MSLGYRYLHGLGGVAEDCESALSRYRLVADDLMSHGSLDGVRLPPVFHFGHFSDFVR